MSHPRFLVIRRDNIGDLVCTTPLIAALRTRHPNAWIGVVANTYNAPVLEGNVDIDAVYAYRKAKHGERSRIATLWERVRMIKALRRQAADYALVATPADRDRGIRIARLAGAKEIVAFVKNGARAAGVDKPLPLDGLDEMSEVERVWRIAQAVGVEGAPPAMKVIPAADVVERARNAISHCGWTATGPLIAIHLSARKSSQRWPAGRFAAVMRGLHERERARFMVFWSPGDQTNLQHPGDNAKARAVLDATVDLPVLAWPTHELRELIGGLAACDRAVLADGGATHIAAALGKPLVVLFGDSDATRWRPWNVPSEILQTQTRNVEDVDVDSVLEAYRRLSARVSGTA